MNYKIGIIKRNNYFFSNSFLLIFLFIISFFFSYCYYTSAHTHLVTKLKNGNFMVFTCDGIYTLDPYFNLYNITTELSCSNYMENIAHFSEEDGEYFIYICPNQHYFFSPYGNNLISYSYSFSNYKNNYQYSIIPYTHIATNFYYFLIYFYSNNIINFAKFAFHSNNNTINYVFNYTHYANPKYNFISCELMNYSNKKVITCFYGTSLTSNNYINCSVFNPENNFQIIHTTNTNTINITNFLNLKSAVATLNGRKRSLVCSIATINSVNSVFYAGYDIDTNELKEGIINLNNKYNIFISISFFSVSYFKETEEFLVSLLTSGNINGETKNLFFIYQFDYYFNYELFGVLRDLTLGDSCCYNSQFLIPSNDLHSILFSSLTQKYCFIGNVNSTNLMTMFIINKELTIHNPVELNANYPLKELICENYTNFNNITCQQNTDIQQILNNKTMKYLEKCTTDLNYIKTNFTCKNHNYKTFNFSYDYCSKKIPNKLVNEDKCVQYCKEEDISNGTCIKDFFVEIEEKLENIVNVSKNREELFENIKNIFSSGIMDEELDNIIKGAEDIIINDTENLIQITSTNNQKNNKNYNISSINIGDCEDILKDKYNISKNTPLLILKIDSFIDGSKIPIIQYEIYNPFTKKKLDLNYCDTSKIEINIPILIDENNLYKYEQNSDYYNNRCITSKSKDGTDIPLNSRRDEFIKNNMSLCETGCDYLGYNIETKNSKCECDPKNEITIFNIKIDTELLYDKFSIVTNSNIDIIKCYYLLFKKEYLTYNIGNYVILFIILVFIISIFFFIFKGYSLLKGKIQFVLSFVKNTRNKIKKISVLTTNTIKKDTKINKNRKNRNKNKNKKISLSTDIKKDYSSNQKLKIKKNENILEEINNNSKKKKKEKKK